MSIGSAIGPSIVRAIGSALAGGGAAAFSPSSLSPTSWYTPRTLSTMFQLSNGTTAVAVATDPIGYVTDLSGNARHAIQATAANRPLLPSTGNMLRSDFSNDILQSASSVTDSSMYVNTPYGWYKSQTAGAHRLPLNDSTEIVGAVGLTGAQEAALATYFGTDRKYMIALNPGLTVSTLNITGAGSQTVTFIGANGVTATRSASGSFGAIDLTADGLTAPVAVVWPDTLTTNTALTVFACHTNQLTGSIPSLAANTALTQFHCATNQLTGSIPSLATNTALTVFYCYANQLTGSIPSLAANTALTQFYCYTNQLTGSIPSLATNTALAVFVCATNQLTGYTGGGVSITLGDFQAQNNLLTQAAVDAILADFVAANKTTGTRLLNLGGTGNATPSATGLTDKATLVSRGWTVTTN